MDALIDRDPQRVCILQGPVAAKHSTVADEPVKQILDDIHEKYVQALLKRYYDGDVNRVPVVPFLSSTSTMPTSIPRGVTVCDGKGYYEISNSEPLPSVDDWLHFLSATSKSYTF